MNQLKNTNQAYCYINFHDCYKLVNNIKEINVILLLQQNRSAMSRPGSDFSRWGRSRAGGGWALDHPSL